MNIHEKALNILSYLVFPPLINFGEIGFPTKTNGIFMHGEDAHKACLELADRGLVKLRSDTDGTKDAVWVLFTSEGDGA